MSLTPTSDCPQYVGTTGPGLTLTSVMSQYDYPYVSSARASVDMSSYVAVTGKPEANFAAVFGLTPQELRYLKVNASNVSFLLTFLFPLFQEKFQQVRRNGENSPQHVHGYTIGRQRCIVFVLHFILWKWEAGRVNSNILEIHKLQYSLNQSDIKILTY